MTEVQEAIRRWRLGGPALFAQEAMGAEPTDQQWDGSRRLAAERRVSIRSGHGTGKSAFMAWAVIWFLVCYFPAKVPATAPTGHQLKDILWAEIATWHRRLGERLPSLAAQFEVTSDVFRMRSDPNESFAVARTARPERPEALQGFHSENILFLVDEASGVPDNVFEVAEGALSTEGAFVVMAANPTRQSGYFFDSHHKMRGSWAALHWDGEKSRLVSRAYIDGMAKKYGRQSPVFAVRVKGDFVAAADGVIPLELCESAKVRDVEQIKAPMIWGLDVGRFGDDSSALAKRRGNVMPAPISEWWGADTMRTVGIVKAEWDATPEADRPEAINVDVIGIGAGVCDRLAELGLPARAINVAESAAENVTSVKGQRREYDRLRDELWFKGRAWLEGLACRMAEDEETIAELTTPVYSVLSSGAIKVESKADMRKRGVKSPNRADALLLTFANTSLSRTKAPKITYRRSYT